MSGIEWRGAAGVLFDVDGTLVDSNYLHVHAWLQAFRSIERPVEAWRIHRAIGMDSAKLLAELLGAEADSLGEQAKKVHGECYPRSAWLLTALPGARELIQSLAARGVRVVLATSAPLEELELLRRVLNVDDAITAVTTADDVDIAKPEPDIIAVAQQRSGCELGDLVFVGDSVWDMQAARRAGITCVGVLSGGISEAELLEAGAAEVFAGPADLIKQFVSG